MNEGVYKEKVLYGTYMCVTFQIYIKVCKRLKYLINVPLIVGRVEFCCVGFSALRGVLGTNVHQS